MDNSIKKIITDGFSSISNIFSFDKSSKEALGIDIGSSAIKVVQLKKKNGKAVLETYGVLSLGPYGNTEVGTVTNLKTEDLNCSAVAHQWAKLMHPLSISIID